MQVYECRINAMMSVFVLSCGCRLQESFCRSFALVFRICRSLSYAGLLRSVPVRDLCYRHPDKLK